MNPIDETKKPSTMIHNSLVHDMREIADGADSPDGLIAIIFDEEKTWDDFIGEREFKECEFAKNYAQEFAHETAGHNRLMLIAKLCEMLDVYEEALDRMIAVADIGRIG